MELLHLGSTPIINTFLKKIYLDWIHSKLPKWNLKVQFQAHSIESTCSKYNFEYIENNILESVVSSMMILYCVLKTILLIFFRMCSFVQVVFFFSFFIQLLHQTHKNIQYITILIIFIIALSNYGQTPKNHITISKD